MRALSPAAVTALSQPGVPMALLVDMALTTPLRLCTGGWQLTWGGNTYTAVGNLGSVAAAEENAGPPRGLSFEISGVPPELLGMALAEPVQGAAVSLYVAIFDPDTYQILDAALEWAGTLDTMHVSDGDPAVISVTAEHAGFDLIRAAAVRYTDVDQQRLFPGDLGCAYVTDQSDAQIVWPAASFYRV